MSSIFLREKLTIIKEFFKVSEIPKSPEPFTSRLTDGDQKVKIWYNNCLVRTVPVCIWGVNNDT